MTVNETWKNCLAMWKWIANKVRENDLAHVATLKKEWLEENGFHDKIALNCFFCEEAGDCAKCPGAKVDSNFRCDNYKYDYIEHPILFYKELVRLNKIRTK